MYKNFYLKSNYTNLSKKKINWWCTGRKVSKHLYNKKVVIPKGLFFRIIRVKKTQIGVILGAFTANRKPFAKPFKETRR